MKNEYKNGMTDKQTNEILELAAAVCNGQITDEQSQRLREILDNNLAALHCYSQYMMLHAELYWLEDAIGAGSTSSSSSTVSLPTATRKSSRSWSWPLSLAAMLLIGLGIGIFSSDWFGNRSPNVVEVVESIDRGERVAQVTGSLNCRWKGQPNQEAIGFGSKLYSGQRLDLVEGVAEVTFIDGARMLLQAPAELDLAPAVSVLHHGRLTATCPPGAEGFRVDTEGLVLIDRGTEFGVMADDEGNTEVHVFDGLVEGHFRDSESGPLRKAQWTTNETVRFESAKNQLSKLDGPETEFVRTLSANLGPVNGLLAGEDFDYPIGRLGGQNGGFGWGGPWVDTSIDRSLPESNAVAAGSLQFGILSSSGNHAALTSSFNRCRRVLSTSFSGVFDTAGFIEDQDGARVIGKEGTTLYISLTQKISKTDEVFYGFELHRGDGNRNRVLCVGHAAARAWTDGVVRAPNKSAGVTGWAVTSESNGGENSLLEIGDLGPETTDVTLFVLKITFGEGNNDTIEVFKDPDSLWDERECEPQVVGKGNFAFDRISLANFEGEKTFEVDQIRIGTSFSAVTRPQWQAQPVSNTSDD